MILLSFWKIMKFKEIQDKNLENIKSIMAFAGSKDIFISLKTNEIIKNSIEEMVVAIRNFNDLNSFFGFLKDIWYFVSDEQIATVKKNVTKYIKWEAVILPTVFWLDKKIELLKKSMPSGVKGSLEEVTWKIYLSIKNLPPVASGHTRMIRAAKPLRTKEEFKESNSAQQQQVREIQKANNKKDKWSPIDWSWLEDVFENNLKKTRFYAPIWHLNAVIQYGYDNSKQSFWQLYYIDIKDDELDWFASRRSPYWATGEPTYELPRALHFQAQPVLPITSS